MKKENVINFAEVKLDKLVQLIRNKFDEIDAGEAKIGRDLLEVRQRLSNNDKAFRQWCKANITLSPKDIKRCMALAIKHAALF